MCLRFDKKHKGNTFGQRALSHPNSISISQDPERSESLEELEVVKEDCVIVKKILEEEVWTTITFTPTVPHCSLATLIGICSFQDNYDKKTNKVFV